jgi:hypothetical protein
MDTLYVLACGSQWKYSPSAEIGRELLRAFCEGDPQVRGLAFKFLVAGGELTRALLQQAVDAGVFSRADAARVQLAMERDPEGDDRTE